MNISITSDILARLQHLQHERKFAETEFYPGAVTEEIRLECERRVNVFLADLIILLQGGTSREDLFVQARVLIETFAEEDTEEREQVDNYIGEAMGIIGLEDWTEHI